MKSSLLALAILAGGLPAAAQSTSPPAPVAAEIALRLRQADGVKRVLMIGAHPDDEDTSLLAALARTYGARTAYLSLTRGEGGQNRIGSELGEELGILRTGELLAARSLDGAEQWFTRAYDFGYSRSAAETFRHWPRDTILADVVRVIRTFRPQVVVSIFGGTSTDGHGQHQAAGLLAVEAFEAAADSTRFPEQSHRGVHPWSASRLFVHRRRDPRGASHEVPTGGIDPLLGRSPHQLAMESRSRHRSQSFGTVQAPGPHSSWLGLVEDRTTSGARHASGSRPDSGSRPVSGAAALFAGVDTALVERARLLSAAMGSRAARLAPMVERYRGHLAAASSSLQVGGPDAAAPALLHAVAALDTARSILAAVPAADAVVAPLNDFREALARRAELVSYAALLASGIRWTARASDDVVVPGQRVPVRVVVWTGGAFGAVVEGLGFATPTGTTVEPLLDAEFPEAPEPFGGTRSLATGSDVTGGAGGAARLAPGSIHTRDFALTLSDATVSSSPYYLDASRPGAFYRWPNSVREPPGMGFEPGTPFQPPPFGIRLTVRPLGLGASAPPNLAVTVRTPVRFRGLDRTTGEFWTHVRIAPTVSVSAHPDRLVIPVGDTLPRQVEVRVRNLDQVQHSARLELHAPEGWSVDPVATPLSLGVDGVSVVHFMVTPPPMLQPGTDGIELEPRVFLDTDGVDAQAYTREVVEVDHPHVEPRLRTRPAAVEVLRFPVRLADRRVAYAGDADDPTLRAAERLGLDVELLEPQELVPSRLDEFDVMLLGVRAYEQRPDLQSANPRLLDWVRRGGVLLVQYNRYDLIGRHFAPYPMDVSRPPVRVTREDAPVRVLDRASPVLNHPNRIGSSDFDGWVQERSTFMPRSWDDRYRTVLSMADPGEPDADGGLLLARVGDGLYAHITLSLFRQLEAGVPGAYRLFTNLLALDPQRLTPGRD